MYVHRAHAQQSQGKAVMCGVFFNFFLECVWLLYICMAGVRRRMSCDSLLEVEGEVNRA